MNLKNRASEIIKRLSVNYPEFKSHLEYKNSFQLLISTVLAAQCTDIRVNMTMTPLYKSKYKTPQDIINHGAEEFVKDIKSITFFNNKTKSIIAICESLIKDHKGKVPDNMEDLTALPGVGRKSASVILGNCFGQKDVIIVDTHLKRVSQRLGLTENDNPEKIEMDLKKIIPDNEQYDYSMRIGEHGRTICDAKKPKCSECFLNDICPFFKTK